MRNSSENMQHICRKEPMQKRDFNKVALHCLLQKHGSRPWTQKNLNPEKRWKQLDAKINK